MKRLQPGTPRQRLHPRDVASKETVSVTHAASSARDFIVEAMMKKPDMRHPANKAGAHNKALEEYAASLGWKRPE